METLKDLKIKISEAIASVKNRMNSEKGFIVCNNEYVNVGEDRGMNGTGVTFNCIYSAIFAIVYKTKEDAYKFGQDFYLVNAKGEVYLQIIDSDTYFNNQIKIAEGLLSFANSKTV